MVVEAHSGSLKADTVYVVSWVWLPRIVVWLLGEALLNQLELLTTQPHVTFVLKSDRGATMNFNPIPAVIPLILCHSNLLILMGDFTQLPRHSVRLLQ